MSAPLPVCASVSESSLAGVLARLATLADVAPELIEVRLDAVQDLTQSDLPALVAACPAPLLATCRPAREGGGWEGSERERLALLVAASAAGAAWVDVEADAVDALDAMDARAEVRAQVLVSRHPPALDPGPAEPQLRALLGSLRHPRAAALKLALPCGDARDALTLLRLSGESSPPTIAIGMGFPGVATRLLGCAGGAPWTYAAAAPAQPTAPGQRSVGALRALAPAPGAAAWFGVLGRPVGHSRSPWLMNAAFRHLGLAAGYAWLETGDPRGLLVEAGRDPRWRGFSLTIPHKGALLDAPGVEQAPEVRAAGALNTLVRAPRGWRAHNTDGLATLALVRERCGSDLRGLSVALLGNGGAARAAAAVLLAAGAELSVYARDPARGAAFADALGARWGGSFGALPRPGPAAPRLVINATSLGMGSDESPLAADALGPGQSAYDLVYTPPRTRFLREAEAAGATTISGLRHFFAQARAQLELWWGERAAALPPLDDPWWPEAATPWAEPAAGAQ